MTQAYQVKIVGALAEEFKPVLGTDTVPISSAIPYAVEINVGTRTGVFCVDLERLTRDQRQRLIEHLASKSGSPTDVVQKEIVQQGLAFPADQCILPRIDQYQMDLIREMLKETAPQVDWATEAYARDKAGFEASILSREIITFMLGVDWWTKNIFQPLGSDDRRVFYLRPSLATEQDRIENRDRIIDLADSLFLLQACTGFDVKIEALRKVSPDNTRVFLEDTAIELQIAKMLRKSGHDIEFVRCSGVKGQDFDLKINFHKRTRLNAEIKCKREDTAASADSLRNSLYRAQDQLPDSGPSVVFVRLPTDWMRGGQFVSQVFAVLTDFFSNADYVNAVVFAWEEWVNLENGFIGRLLKYRLELNPAPRYRVDGLNGLFGEIDHVPKAAGTRLLLSFGEFK